MTEPFDTDHRCPNCFKPREPAPRCPHCGFDPASASDGARYLPPFTRIGGRYLVGRILGRPGGYGVVYAGYDCSLHSATIAIKEFLLTDGIAERARDQSTIQPVRGQEEIYAQWRQRFIDEARLLASLRDASRVVTVHDLLEDNNTAYLVMERLEGENLGDYLHTHGPLNPDAASDLAEYLFQALESLHNREEPVLHRDLSPSNIFLRDCRLDGLTLLDFGLARAGEPGPVRTVSAGYGTQGYRAPEQIRAGHDLGPWTDLYACGALLYLAVTGKPPVDALDRLAGTSQPSVRVARPGLPAGLANLIDACLQKDPEKRPANVAAARALLSATTLAPEPDPEPESGNGPPLEPSGPTTAGSKPPEPPPKPRWPAQLGIALLIGILAAGGYQIWKSRKPEPVESSSPPNSARPAPTPPPEPAPGLDPEEQRRREAIADLVARLDRQLAARRYTRPENDNALTTVEALAALDPRHPAVARARQAMGDFYQQQIEALLAKEQPGRAEDYLARGRRAQPDRADWAALEARIAGEKQRIQAVAGLVERLQAQLAERRYLDNGAGDVLDTLQELAALAPGHPVIPQARQRMGDAYLARARESLASGDLEKAGEALARGRQVQPGRAEWAVLEKRIATEKQSRQAIADLVARLDRQLAARRYTRPENDNALATVEALARLDPDHPAIARARQAMGDFYQQQIEALLAKEQPGRAEDYLARGRRAQPERADWAALEARIQSLRETLKAARRLAEEQRLAENEKARWRRFHRITIPPDAGTTPGRFTKIGADGRPLPASARHWSCVRDNITGLIWEVKTDDGGLHDEDHTYTWYDPNPKTNGGASGVEDGGKCAAGVRCDTTGFAEAVNRVGLCGAWDWRVPTREELRSIVDLGRKAPAIDTAWFPNTPSSDFWSASPAASGSGFAWGLVFYDGGDGWFGRSGAGRVRLVRAGQ